MAKPKLENGYLRLANELIEALMRLSLSCQESRIFWVVIRETLGWGKKEKAISLARFSELTGISRPNVCHTLKKLQRRKIVVRNKNKFGLQEDYLRWKGIKKLPKRAIKTIAQVGNVAQVGNAPPLSKQTTSQKMFPKQGTKTIVQTDNAPSNIVQIDNTPPLSKQTMKLSKQTTNIVQTDNGNPELVNEHKQIPAPKDIKYNIKNKERTTAKILLIFSGKTTTKKILKAIKDKDPDEMIALAKDCQEREDNGEIGNARGLFFRLAREKIRIPRTENKPKDLPGEETEKEFERRRVKDIGELKKKCPTGSRSEPLYKQQERLKRKRGESNERTGH